MNRKTVLRNLLLLFGTILLVLTVFEYLVRDYPIIIDPVLYYGIQVFYLLSILVFLVLLFIFLNPKFPKKDMS